MSGAPSQCVAAVARRPGGRRRKRLFDYPEPELLTEPPAVCTKPGCGGRLFIPHEEGWQCWNCMKIIYRSRPLEPFDSDSR
jgi:hypothetical protein